MAVRGGWTVASRRGARAGALLLLALALAVADLPPLPGASGAQAQERSRSLIDMLFGGPSPRRRSLEPPPPRVIRKAPARPGAPRSPARKASAKASPAKAPEPVSAAVEKSPTAKSVLVVGDFMAASLAKGLTNAMAENPEVRVVDASNGSSGLVRDDHYDWPAAIGPLIDAQKPALVAVMLGSNERQPIEAPGGALPLHSEEWGAEYDRRAKRLAEIVASKKIPLVWVGMPSFKSDRMNDDMPFLNDIYRQTSLGAGGDFVDVWEGFVDAGGAFAATGPDIDGQTARLRNSDGITMTKAGAEKLAFFAEKPILRILGVGAAGSLPISLSLDGQTKPGEPAAGVANATSAPATALNDPSLDGGGELLTAGPGKPASKDLSPREKLVISGIPSEAAAGRADDFSWSGKEAAVSPAREGAAVVSRGSFDLGRLRVGDGVKPAAPMPSLADAIIEDWNGQARSAPAVVPAPGSDGQASAAPPPASVLGGQPAVQP